MRRFGLMDEYDLNCSAQRGHIWCRRGRLIVWAPGSAIVVFGAPNVVASFPSKSHHGFVLTTKGCHEVRRLAIGCGGAGVTSTIVCSDLVRRRRAVDLFAVFGGLFS